MKLDTLRILSSHRLLYFSPSTHVNGRLMEYIGRKTEIYIYIYTVVCENRNHQFRNRQGVTLNGSSLTIERERGGGSGVSRDESRRTTSSTISRYISSYRIIMYYNTRPVRRPLMDLIDFRRVPESAGQTHYFSPTVTHRFLRPFQRSIRSSSPFSFTQVRVRAVASWRGLSATGEQDFGSRVGVPTLSRGMEGTRQGESRSDRYFYCPSQVWFQGG